MPETAERPHVSDCNVLRSRLRFTRLTKSLPRATLFQRQRLLRFFNDFFKARIAAERVPKREQLKHAVARG
jgi:hypothetical protein